MESQYTVAVKPLWLRKRQTLQMFEIGARKLDRWTKNGYVRTLKIDEGQRGSRIFYIPDIEDLLLRMAAGHKLRIKHGKKEKYYGK